MAKTGGMSAPITSGDVRPGLPQPVYHGYNSVGGPAGERQCYGTSVDLFRIVRAAQSDTPDKIDRSYFEGSIGIAAIFPNRVRIVPKSVYSTKPDKLGQRAWRKPKDIAARCNRWLAGLAERL
jgi:hypothetical protein